jgi:hypothetical protein
MPEYVVVPEADDTVSAPHEECCSPYVPRSVPRVLAPVELDDQARLRTAEIGDEWPDAVLAPELGAEHLTVPQASPQRAFGIRLLTTKLPRSIA